MAYSSPIPALPPLQSGAFDSHAPAIAVGEPHHNDHVIAARKQLDSRRHDFRLHPQLVTEAELVDAEKRFHQVMTAQMGVVESNHDVMADEDTDPHPDWVQLILNRIDAQRQQLNRIEYQMNTFSRQILQEIQRSMNRNIRNTWEPLVPLVRIEDGTIPSNLPATMEEFSKARAPQINELLQFYHLEADRTLDDRKKKLQQYLGVNL